MAPHRYVSPRSFHQPSRASDRLEQLSGSFLPVAGSAPPRWRAVGPTTRTCTEAQR
jgi:hypothetical protein